MVQEPRVQKRAREELDSVIGRERLPTFEDRDDLPYINALCKEVLRWHPVLPLGIPHGSVSEDVYKGMRIPKGTAVVPNAWYVDLVKFYLPNCRHLLLRAMSRNEGDYGDDANAFRPERFLEAKRRDPTDFVFGFGRRCVLLHAPFTKADRITHQNLSWKIRSRKQCLHHHKQLFACFQYRTSGE